MSVILTGRRVYRHSQTIFRPVPPPLLASALLFSFAPDARAAVTEKPTRSYPLPADGVRRLENVSSDITIEAEKGKEVPIEAEKRDRDPRDLQQITIDFEARPGRVAVKTTLAKNPSNRIPGQGSRAAVTYMVRVPRDARFERIASVNSSITVQGVRGPVELHAVSGSVRADGLARDTRLESVNGSITADVGSLENVRSVDLKSVYGQIELTVPKGANARSDVRTTNGRASVEPAITLSDSGRRRISGEIGMGSGPLLRAETTNCSVTVRER